MKVTLPEKYTPVIVLDLDGTVRHGYDELGRFVNSPADVVIFDGVRDRLVRYKEHGWRIIAATNQGGIALGFVSLEDVMAACVETQKQVGNVFDRISICRHHPDAEDLAMARCWCRKPRPGGVVESLVDLAAQTRIEAIRRREGNAETYPPHLALFVGDRPEDEECARNLNMDFMPAADWRAGAHSLP